MNKMIMSSILFSLFMAFFACSDNNKITGVIEGGNTKAALNGYVYDTTGVVQPNTSYRIRKSMYLHKNTATDSLMDYDGQTDSTGYYELNQLDTGSYYIEFNNQLKMLSISEFTYSGELITLKDTLSPAITIRGKLTLDSTQKVKAQVLIYGLERRALVDSLTGEYEFDNMAAGKFSFRFESQSESDNWEAFEIEDKEINENEELEEYEPYEEEEKEIENES